jgi:methyl-accepting chemotaxis protein
MSTVLPSRSAFKARVIGKYFSITLPGMAIIIALFVALLHLTSEERIWLLALAGSYGVAISLVALRAQSRILEPVAIYLDRHAGERIGDEQRRAAFAAVLDLPRKSAALAAVGSLVLCSLISISMGLQFGGFGWSETLVVTLSGIATGFVLGGLVIYRIKRDLDDVRGALTAEMRDPGVRRALTTPFSLRAKMVGCVVGMTAASLAFAAALFLTQTNDALEEFTVRWEHGVLEALAVQLEQGDLVSAMKSVLGEEPNLMAPLDVKLLNLAKLEIEDAGQFEAGQLSQILEEHGNGAERGSNESIRSRRIFAWRSIGGDHVLIASSPRGGLKFNLTQMWIAFSVLIVIAISIGVMLARLISSDVSRTAESLRAATERIASGDLRSGRVLESEDELGELSRSFEEMTESLRLALSRVANASDLVETTVREITTISENVAAVTADQAIGIQQVSSSMEAINAQVRGIAESSQSLSSSVEESSSSILELGASGQDLNETAGTLSAKVDEVSSSIEQMIRSVSQVAETTESLAGASSETSSSMDQMASSLREVDGNAEESARLSHQVVASAESGQTKVRQTIEGMDAIREATEIAEEVIRNLAGRTKKIGAVVDVIDDVADETSLLALNAAIIAAQAGEHGKAFSVVADEIKDLADRVLASTNEIGSLIRGVQEEGSNAIGAIERGAQSVASGVDLSAEAGISLEEITRASRESGTRIQGIVMAVREQARAAAHVVGLMERVRGGVEEIRNAAKEQERGNTVVYRSATTMRDVALQVRSTTEEQARGSGRMRESIVEVQMVVEKINDALQEQTAACRSAVNFLEDVYAQTRSNEDSARQMDQATKGLLRQSEGLRVEIQRFRLSDSG